MKKELKFMVNGESYDLWIEPKTLLVQVLRDELGFKGTKRSCDSGSCCACTVILDGKVVKSCSILALQANGKEVLTIEGLANGPELHPIQQAFIDNWAFQCGFALRGKLWQLRHFWMRMLTQQGKKYRWQWMATYAVVPGTIWLLKPYKMLQKGCKAKSCRRRHNERIFVNR